jgi:hypothetical protein
LELKADETIIPEGFDGLDAFPTHELLEGGRVVSKMNPVRIDPEVGVVVRLWTEAEDIRTDEKRTSYGGDAEHNRTGSIELEQPDHGHHNDDHSGDEEKSASADMASGIE